MKASGWYEFRVKFVRDKETGQVVASIPTLDIADYGDNPEQASQRLKRMAIFHLESLMDEGEPVPEEKPAGEGLYLRFRVPAVAA